MIDLNKVNWEGIIISAIENPNKNDKNFEELEKKATEEDRYFSQDKVIFENDKYKLIFRIGWDKNKFFFLYESVVIAKQSNQRIIGTDDAPHHKSRHIHSGKFIIPNPMTLIEKLEHPILSLIVRSETEERRRVWVNKLANELKNSQINWRELFENRLKKNLKIRGNW